MIWEDFEERLDAGFYMQGTRFWVYEYHFGNIEGKISKHTAPTEVELGLYGRLHKVSPKTGRVLDRWVGFMRMAYHEGEYPDSRYVAQAFETKEECAEAYANSINFWLGRVEAHRVRMNQILNEQIRYMRTYRSKIPQ